MEKIEGKYLRDMREAHGYSLRAFADKIYVSKSAVQRWEQTSVPEYADILEHISEVFGVTVDEMRKQSHIKYGAHNDREGEAVSVAQTEEPENADIDFTPEELAELKFGFRWLWISLAILGGLSFIVILLFLIV